VVHNQPSDQYFLINAYRGKIWIEEGHDEVFEEVDALL
jgi:hypothetical protein